MRRRTTHKQTSRKPQKMVENEGYTNLPKNYFKLVNPLITVVIILGLFVMVTIMAFSPNTLTEMRLGVLGDFLHNISTEYSLATKIFYLLCLSIHTLEGCIGFYLSCVKYKLTWTTVMKWTFSSFINGYFSLRFLVKPKL